MILSHALTKKAWGFLYTFFVREVMRIYEIYIDIYFIENAMLDAAILTLALFLMGKRMIPWRIALAASVGGVSAVLILIFGIKYGIFYILAVLATDFMMFLVAGNADTGEKMLGIVYFHALAFAYTKLEECAAMLGIWKGNRVITLAVLIAMIMLIAHYQSRRRAQRIYMVTITENSEHIELKALFDTGNSLTEPMSQKPVSIIEENETIKLWLAAQPERYRVIPFRSIGKEHGILEGTMVDELIIWKKDRQIVHKDVIVALYKGKLSKDGSYQMILNQGLL